MSKPGRNFWRRHLDSWVALALWVVALLLVVLTGGPVGLAVRGTIATGVSIVSSPLLWIPRTIALWPENAQLRQELMQAKSELSYLLEAREENERLREMIGFVPPPTWTTKTAEVIGRYRRIGNRRVIVNIGANEGILPPMPVMTTTGLVGRVLRVRMGAAEVQVLGDPQMGVAVRNQRSRVEGILRADHSGRLTIDGVPLTSDVKYKDIWVTAGVGVVYPKGIPVAKQLPIPAPSSHFQILPVEPVQNIDAVESVFILTSYGQVEKEGDVDQ
ncbi:MAG: rod shape-determining protein MreC [bacterium]|nr:rod shape-determining protein MreC [bacterium]